MSNKLKWTALFVSGLVVVALLVWLPPGASPSPILPDPNGYDVVLAAADLVIRPPDGYDPLDGAGLRAVVSSNAGALREIRKAFDLPSRVRPADQAGLDDRVEDLSKAKVIALAFAGEGRLHEQEGRPVPATASYVDCLRTGLVISRGGEVISRLVGIACESIGIKGLRRLMPELDASVCQTTAAAVGEVLRQSDTAEQTLAEERRFWRRNSGIGEIIFAPILRRQAEKAVASATGKIRQHQLQLTQLMVEFAAWAHELERRTQPRSWEDLVPRYLPVIPRDPATGQPLDFPVATAAGVVP